MNELDEKQIDTMLEELLEAAEDEPQKFTSFELEFLESMSDIVENWHLSERQVAKLEEIYEERIFS